MYFIELKSTIKQTVDLGKHLFGESALYILEGSIVSEEHTYQSKQILIAKDSSLCSFTMNKNTTVYIFGGEPFPPEERYIHWNFVSSSKEKIEQAKTDWKNQTFDKVPGETEFVPPLPEPKTK